MRHPIRPCIYLTNYWIYEPDPNWSINLWSNGKDVDLSKWAEGKGYDLDGPYVFTMRENIGFIG